MAKVTVTGISPELTAKEIEELEALEDREIVYDDDSPRMTEQMLAQFHSFDYIPLRIERDNYSVVHSFGGDYQKVLTRLLNLALRDGNLINKSRMA